jgi:hypothetical protein
MGKKRKKKKKKLETSRVWWCTPVSPALGRLRQQDPEFRPAWATGETLSQNKQTIQPQSIPAN